MSKPRVQSRAIAAAPRWVTVLPFAAVITVALMIMMAAMVSVDAEAPSERRAPLVLDIVTESVSPPETYDRPRPLPPEPAPDLPETSATVVEGNGEPGDGFPPLPPTKPNLPLGPGLGPGLTPDIPPTPVLRIEQRYPPAALRAGAEGRCQVTFDVFADGSVGNIRPPVCSDRRFAREAVRAVSGYRYTPTVAGGSQVVYEGAVIELAWALGD